MGLTFFAQVILLHASYATIRPMVSYRALELGASASELGFVAGSFSLLPLLLAFTIGRLADRWGSARLMAAGASVIVLGGVLALVAGSMVALLLACSLLGLGHLTALLSQQATAASQTSSSPDQAFGRLTSVIALGGVIGPPAAGMAAHAWSSPGGQSQGTIGVAVASAFAIVALPLCLVPALRDRTSRSTTMGRSRAVVSEIVRVPGMWQAMVVGGAVICAMDLLLVYLPAWAQEEGISVAVVGWMLALRAGTTVAVRLLTARVVRWVGRRAALTGCVLLAAAGFASLPMSGTVSGFVLMVVLGCGLGLSQPITMSWMSAAVAPENHGTALGMRLSFNRLAQVTIPASVGVLAAGSGAEGVFWSLGALLGAASGLVLRAPIGTRDDPG